MRELQAGRDYGSVFGLETEKGSKMIYNGGISWTGAKGEKEVTMDSQKQTDFAAAYINKPGISIGGGIA